MKAKPVKKTDPARYVVAIPRAVFDLFEVTATSRVNAYEEAKGGNGKAMSSIPNPTFSRKARIRKMLVPVLVLDTEADRAVERILEEVCCGPMDTMRTRLRRTVYELWSKKHKGGGP